MEKAKVRGFSGILGHPILQLVAKWDPFIFAKPRPVLITVLFVIISCVLGYVAGTGYANVSPPKMPQNRRLVTTGVLESVTKTNEWLTVPMRVTAYCPCAKCCGEYSDGVTASGHKINGTDFFVAADAKYPFGTEMIVPGYKNGEVVKVLDRGGVIRGSRLDVFFNSHQQALEWSVRYLDVKIRRRILTAAY